MILGIKVRLNPTLEQEKKLWKSVGTARFVYNWTLAKQEENYKKCGKFICDNDLRKEITKLKNTELLWLSEVSNNVAKQAVKDACKSYIKFFYKKCGRPKFKSKKRSKQSFYNDNQKLKVRENEILIEKIGWIKIKKNEIPLNSKYTNPRISFDGKYWFISLGIDKEKPKIHLSDEVIGIDLGIKDLAICSNGIKFEHINKTKEVKKYEKKLCRLQRKATRKYEKNKEGRKFVETQNIIKIEKKIKLLQRKLANIRSNHIHQATCKIVKTKPSRIVMETLNIRRMMKNKHLSKVISKQELYEFKRQIRYKSKLYGIEFLETDNYFNPSKICSGCNNKKVVFSLLEREYICEKCGLIIDRSINTSINLSRYELSV